MSKYIIIIFSSPPPFMVLLLPGGCGKTCQTFAYLHIYFTDMNRVRNLRIAQYYAHNPFNSI